MSDKSDVYPSSSSSSEFEDEEEVRRTMNLKPLADFLLPAGILVPRPQTSRGRSRDRGHLVTEDENVREPWSPEPGDNTEIPMEVDTDEYIWTRTRDIKITGNVCANL